MTVSEINHKTRFIAEIESVKERIEAVLIALKAEGVPINWKIFKSILEAYFDQAEQVILKDDRYKALHPEELYYRKVMVAFEGQLDFFSKELLQHIKTERARELMGSLAAIATEPFHKKIKELTEILKFEKGGEVLEFKRRS